MAWEDPIVQGQLHTQVWEHLILELCDTVDLKASLQRCDVPRRLLHLPPEQLHFGHPRPLLLVPGTERLELGLNLAHLRSEVRIAALKGSEFVRICALAGMGALLFEGALLHLQLQGLLT